MVEDVSMTETRQGKPLRFSLKSMLVVAIIIALIIAGWAIQFRETRKTSTTAPTFNLTNLPAEMTVKQRSTTAVPGSDGALVLTVDDITRGQVMASLATSSGDTVLSSRSMSPDDAVPFKISAFAYSLKLKQLNNALIGEDFATFIVSTASDAGLTEEEKTERLIGAVAELQDAKFIRNGEEYSAAEAADHLRRKWRAAGGEIKSADEFIDAIASKSSATGESYQIRMSDGKIVPANEYLRKVLGELE
jgi:hypothetical protein